MLAYDYWDIQTMTKNKLTKTRDVLYSRGGLIPNAKPWFNYCRETLFGLEMSAAGWLQLKFNHDSHKNQRMSTGK